VLFSVETWSYDFGPSRFTQVVTLEGGRIVRIERGSYGHATGEPRPARIDVARCEPAALDVGDTKLDVLALCGEPFSIDRRREEVVVVAAEGALPQTTAAVEVEVWTFNFGRRRLLRVVELVDGKVTRVESGGYGYGE
jgi:hypothetical protein